MIPHHTELITSMIAAIKKARRWGAASSQIALQGAVSGPPLTAREVLFTVSGLMGMDFKAFSFLGSDALDGQLFKFVQGHRLAEQIALVGQPARPL